MKRIFFILCLVACADSVQALEVSAPHRESTPAPIVAPRAVYVPLRGTVETAPPTTTEPPLGFEPRCPNLLPAIREAGFPREDWAHMDYLGWREARCAITADGEPRCAHNPDDPAGGSWGPWQVNQGWVTRNRWNPHPSGYLGALGIANTTADLCDWNIAAQAAYALYNYSLTTHGYDQRFYQWRT